MANRYWVGGTDTWDATAGTKWALTSGGAGGQAVPTSADDVFFDASSGANTVTISVATCKSLNCTGFTGTFSGTATIAVAGSVTLVAGMTFPNTIGFTLTGTGTLTTAGKTLGATEVSGSGITVTLGGALTLQIAATFTLTQGTFDTANYNFTTGSLSSNNSNTRTLTLGSSTVSVPGTITFTTSTNFTLNAGTSTISTGGAAGGITHNLGGLTYYNFTFTTTGNGEFTITGANTFNNFTITGGTSSGYCTWAFAANQTINGTFTANAGTNGSCRRFFRSNTIGTARTITAATTTLSDIDFQDITAAGAGSWSGTRIGNGGGNSGITFTGAKTVYYVAATATGWMSTNWATSSGGATSGNNYPLPQDTGIVDDNSGTGTLTIAPANNTRIIGAVSCSTRTIALTLSDGGGSYPHIYVGSITLSSAVTPSGTGTMILSNRTGTLSITTAGRTWTEAFNIQAVGATVQLADNCTTSNTVTSTNGTLDLNGKTLSITSYITAAGTKDLTFNGGTIAISNATTTAWNNAQPTGFTTTAGTGTGKISMTAATAKTFVGGGSTYNCTLSNDGAGALTISGSNTFTNMANGVQPTTFTFTSGTTQIFTSFTVSGTAGNLVTLGASTTSQATLQKSTQWYMGANSTDGGNNSNLTFTAGDSIDYLSVSYIKGLPAIAVSGGNFFMLF